MITGIIRALVAAGATPEMILAAVEAYDQHTAACYADETARVEERRRKDRDRKSAKRNGIPDVSADVRGIPADMTDTPPDKESPQTPKETTTPQKETTSLRSVAKKIAPRDGLLAVLDEQRADAVIEHRARLRKPLTAHAARLLAGKFAECPDPNAAADAMIANGWQGFDPDWLLPANRGPPRRQSPVLTAYAELMSEMDPGTINGHANLLAKPAPDRGRTGDDVLAIPANGSEPGRSKTTPGRVS